MTASTGLYPKQSAALRGNEHGLKHGHNRKGNPSPTYNSWVAMCRRVRAGRPGYENVIVCGRWLGVDGFSNFLADMGERPLGTTLHRVNNGNYEPGAVVWASASEQQRNKRPLSAKARANIGDGHRGLKYRRRKDAGIPRK